MALSNQYDKAVLTGAKPPYRLGFLVYMKMAQRTEWVDLNAPDLKVQIGSDLHQTNSLVVAGKFPSISWKPQKKTGRFTISVNEITVDNTLKIFTVDPSTLKFWNTAGDANYTLAAWRNRRVKIVLYEQATTPGTWTEQVLGQFKIKSVSHHAESRTARIQFVGREQDFIETDGTDLRIGDAWPTDVPIPALLERIVEIVGKGDFSVSSDNPTTYEQDTDGTKYISGLGKVPRVLGNGAWNQKNEFVCRYMYIAPNAVIYFVGYNSTTNVPSTARWDRGADTWVQKDFANNSTWKGCEAVFCAQSDTYNTSNIYVCVTANIVGYSSGSSGHNPRNHLLHIVKLKASDLSYVSDVSQRPVWLMHQLVQKGGLLILGYYHAYQWGYDHSGTGGVGPHMQFPFESQFHYASLLRPAYHDSNNLHLGQVSGEVDVEEGTDIYSIKVFNDIQDDDYDESTTQYTVLSSIVPKGAIGLTGAIYTNQIELDFFPPFACSYATGAPHDSFRWDGEHRHRIYWLQFYEAPDNPDGAHWRLYSFSIEDEDGAGAGYGEQILNFGSDPSYLGIQAFYDYNITAFDMRVNGEGSGYLWIAYERHTEVDVFSGEILSSNLVRFTLGAGTLSNPTALTFDSDEQGVSTLRRYSPRIVSIRHNTASGISHGLPLFGCVLNRYAPAGPCYGLWYYWGAADRGMWKGRDETHLPTSAMPFEVSNEAGMGSTTTDCYVQDQSTGVLWLISASSGVFDVSILANADAVDRENTWSSSNLLADSATGRVYGVAASGPPADTQVPTFTKDYWDNHNEDFPHVPELGLFTPGGRLVFWSYDSKISDTVDVFDVSGQNAWDACESLRGIAGNFVMYMNSSLELVLRERGSNVGAAIGTIVQAGENPTNTTFNDPVIAAASVESKIDYDSIVNHATVRAFSPERSPVDVQLIIGPSSKAEGAVIVAHQSNNRAQRITLKCAAPGIVQDDLTYQIGAGAVSLKKYDGKIPALLFSWIKEQDDITTALLSTADINTSLIGVYGISQDASGGYKIGDTAIRIGDTVLVSGGDSRTITGFFLTVGVQLDGPVGGNAEHKIGTTVTISPAIDRRYSNSARGVCKLTAAFTTGTADAGVLYVDTTENLAEGMVLEYKGFYCSVLSIINSTSVHVFRQVLGSARGGTSYAAPIPVDGVMNGFLWIRRSGRAYKVPGTGVSFSITQRAANQSSVGLFAAGDRIILTCEGYGVRELKHWIIRSTNEASVEDYGKMPWKPGVKNRLMTPTRARNLLTQLADLADPRYLTTAKGMPLLVSTTVGDAWNVQSEHALGVTDAIKHEVTGITWHLSNATMDLQLRSIDETLRSGDSDIDGQAPAAGGGYRGDRPRERRRT